MKIEFVSDGACPWGAVGLAALERALERIGSDIPVELRFEPFELNPTLGPEGSDAAEYLRAKYGLSAEQLARNRENIRQRGAAVGFEFGERAHVWNTFDAHRLLCWAGLEGHQRELKHALLEAYHGQGRNPGAHDVLVELAGKVGLDPKRAAAILESDEYAAEVRAREAHWQELGVHAVPSVIVDDRHLIQGGQPPEVFEQALRRIAAEQAPA
jgi:predicted DsbA family dithiol-disulfide isomerase